MPDLPTLYARYRDAKDRQALAEPWSEEWGVATNEVTRTLEAARELTGQRHPFLEFTAPDGSHKTP